MQFLPSTTIALSSCSRANLSARRRIGGSTGDLAKLEGEFHAGRWGEGVRWRSWLGLVLGVDSGRDGGYMEAMDL